MTAGSRDRQRAAAIGNTQALKDVLIRRTSKVACDRHESDPDTLGDLDADSYARVLGGLVMRLIENERTNATRRGFAIHDENANALTSAVQQIRRG